MCIHIICYLRGNKNEFHFSDHKQRAKMQPSIEDVDQPPHWLGSSYSVHIIIELWHGISNNVVCETSKVSDQPAHMRSLIRAFASRLNIL